MLDISRIAISKGSLVPDHVGRVNKLIEDVAPDEIVSDVRVIEDTEEGGFVVIVKYARYVPVPDGES